MGTSFVNLQVRYIDVAKVEALCPHCISRAWTEGWVTVVGEALERAGVQREAKRLSEALAAPVLSVEYVDDDYLELALYCGGRRVFRHIPAPYEDILRQQGKAEPPLLKYYHVPCGDKYRMFLLGFFYCPPEEREKPDPQWEFILDVVGDSGEVLMSLDGTNADGCEYACFLDEQHLYYRKSCYHIPSGVREWSLPVTGESRSGPICVLPKGRFAVVGRAYDTLIYNNLTVFDCAGSICAACSFAGAYDAWDRVLLWGEDLLYLYSDEACRVQLVCLDMALAEKWRIMLAEDGVPTYAEAALDASTEMLYLQLPHPSKIIAVHLPERRITAVRQLEQGSRCRLTSRLEGMGPVVELGSTVEVLDQGLHTISRHRIRGEILQYIPRDGRLQLVNYIRSKYKTVFRGSELIFEDTRQACAFLYTLKEKCKKHCPDR